MDLEHIRQLNVPHLDEYFGVWAVDEDRFRAAVERINGLDLTAHIQAAKSAGEGQAGYPASPNKDGSYAGELTQNGIAVIDIAGTMMKFASSLDDATGTVAVRRALRAAVADDRVKAIMLRIDSPGGTVSGTSDLADDVSDAAGRKPLHAYIEDLGASAAYWVASQAGRISAGRTSLVGSIGTFAVLYDLSAMAAREGIKVHVLRAGAFKGAGTPGTEITPEQLSEWQRIVDELNAFFLDGVARGRKMSAEQVASLADGRVHVAAAAKKSGLIDGVGSFDTAMRELAKSAGLSTRSSKTSAASAALHKEQTMSEQTTPVATAEPQAATIAELEASFPKAGAEFHLACLKKHATLAQAHADYNAVLQGQLEAARAELAQAKSAPPTAPAGSGGAPALTSSARPAPASAGDPIDAWNQAVDEKCRAGMKRAAAIAAVVHEDPDLHASYLEAYNARNKSARR